MTFQETLCGYLKTFDLSRAGLARVSGLSSSAVARYCAGERVPEPDGEELKKLAAGLARAAKEKGGVQTPGEIEGTLRAALDLGRSVDYDAFLSKLKTLLSVLDVRYVSLARALSFDPSHISKILSGQRRPGNVAQFTAEVSAYLAERAAGTPELETAADLMDADPEVLSSQTALAKTIADWLCAGKTAPRDSGLDGFLSRVDSFDLDAFIRSLRFDDVRLPTLPFSLPTTKTYTGVKEMMESELDFIRATLLSRSTEDCVFYSDMPLEEMAGDPEFPKKWMFGMAMLLKKGLRLHIIHDVHRPFREMMLGLEANVPMYMTGLISPYYLPNAEGRVFSHLLKVSGAAALEGSAIRGHQAEGRYVLTKSKEELRFYRQKADRLLAEARPLMEIYRSDSAAAFAARRRRLFEKGDRRVVCCSLPLFTMSKELLDAVLRRFHFTGAPEKEIRDYYEETRAAALSLLQTNRITLVIPSFSPAQLKASPPLVSLSDVFFPTDLPYLPEEFEAHTRDTLAFAKENENCFVEVEPAPAFRNVTVTVVGSETAVVSKNKSPTIHFVIRHKKIVRAFERFSPPITEKD